MLRISHSIVAVVLLTSIVGAGAALAAPNYQQTMLTALFPAGAGRGQSVEVTLRGNAGGLAGATGLVIDGPAGITVRDFKLLDDSRAVATLEVSPDAAAGRRMVRVKGGASGLTNFRWFFVSPLAEHVEQAKNNTLDQAEQVETPTVVNGRVDPAVDQDCFRFRAAAGQRIVAAVVSHNLDAMGFSRDTAGFADTSLELLDEAGNVVAESGDAIGFDPLIEYTALRDGWYTARISGMGYKGFPELVYRLVLGDVPYPTAVFPVSGRRGETVTFEFTGPGVPPGTKRSIHIDDDPHVVQYVSPGGPLAGLCELPVLRSDLPQQSEEPAVSREAAPPLALPVSVSASFAAPGQRHWHRLSLNKGEGVLLETTAQRHLRSPVDMRIEVFDAAGELAAQNDDGVVFAGECSHDFVPFDSHLVFTAKASGEYFVCVSEQSGASGPRSAYQLVAKAAEPDFRLYQWPDAVPIWGPGTTAAFVVEIHRLAGLKEDVEVSVEGLPTAWGASPVVAYLQDYKDPRGAFGHKLFLTITAPADAAIGEMVEFHVVGRAKVGDREIERRAHTLTQYAWGEPNRFRSSPVSRAVVARPTGMRLDAVETHLSAAPGTTVIIPFRMSGETVDKGGKLSLSLNRATTHFKCSLGPPINVDASPGEKSVPFTIPEGYAPGRYYLVVADGWGSETRRGLPGPCTELITLDVAAPTK